MSTHDDIVSGVDGEAASDLDLHSVPVQVQLGEVV